MMKFASLFGLLGLLLASTCAPVTAQPATDVYLVDMQVTGTTFTFGQPQRVTSHEGYDNQPNFLPDGTGFLYVSLRGGQTDVYRYDLAQGSATQVTHTPESEYSPTVMPGDSTFSVVQVEADQTQRLWRFPLAGGTPQLLVANLKPVGYHVWGNPHTVGVFILGNPNTFQVVDLETGAVKTVADHVGRSFHKMPRQNAVSFVNKNFKPWSIDRYDLRSGYITPVMDMIEGTEDYAWLPDQTIALAARGSKLYAWEAAFDGWKQVADFSAAGITNITRLAVSPAGTHLAFVADGV